MNRAVQKLHQQYVDMFLEELVNRQPELEITVLSQLWTEVCHRKPVSARKRAKERKSGQPKKPSGYVIFCNEHRDQFSHLPFGEVSKALGDLWKMVSVDKKAEFTARSKALRQTSFDESEKEENDSTTAVSNPTDDHEDDFSVSSSENEEEEEETTTLHPVHTAKLLEVEKVSKSNKKEKEVMPSHLSTDRERTLWKQFSDLRLQDMRQRCQDHNLPTSKTRSDMIRSLMNHHIELENDS